MSADRNPFHNPFDPGDADRHAIWDMLVRRDIEAYLRCDWDTHARDLVPDGFLGIDGRGSPDPDAWSLAYGRIEDYAALWLASARDAASGAYTEARRAATYGATHLSHIDVAGDQAVAHKKFDGALPRADGGADRLLWQTLYLCRRVAGAWRIAGFLGFLPNPMGGPAPRGAVSAPASGQHVTAGPYSPVLEVRPGRLVVISGQVGVDDAGVREEGFEDEVRRTLANCERQLRAAGLTLNHVFKVNAYLADLARWPEFNRIYSAAMTEPLPVRTTVQAGLLGDLRVEIEMWAAS